MTFEPTETQLAEMRKAASRFIGVFRPEVLAQYDAQPHKYQVKRSDFEGEVSISNTYAESLDYQIPDLEKIHVRFGYRRLKSGQYGVAAFMPDFQMYGAGQLAHWGPFLIPEDELEPGRDLRFEPWAARHLLGSWEVDNNVLERIQAKLRLLNGMTSVTIGHSIFDHAENNHLKAPGSESDHAYQDAHRELYALLLDGLSENAVNAILERSENASSKQGKQRRQRLECALGDACPTLWVSLDLVSRQRGLASHKVRPPAKPFGAFEAFVSDLEQTEKGLEELVVALEALFDVNAETAAGRHESLKGLPAIVRKPENTTADMFLHRAEGKRLIKVEWGPTEDNESCHRREIVHLHFEDGSILWIDSGSNAWNVASEYPGMRPSDFDVYVWAGYVPALADDSE